MEKDINNKQKELLIKTDDLLDTMEELEGMLRGSILTYTERGQLEEIDTVLTKAKLLKPLIEAAKGLKLNLISMTSNDLNNDLQQKGLNGNANSEPVAAVDRTAYRIEGNYIKIETSRLSGKPYSNVLPLAVYKNIALLALDLAEKNSFVTITDVEKILGNKIMQETNYKKSSRHPVYLVFKCLTKESYLKKGELNSQKYQLIKPINEARSEINDL